MLRHWLYSFCKSRDVGNRNRYYEGRFQNPGFNNVLRVSTRPRAAIALIGDISKGLIAVLLLSRGVSTEVVWAMGIAAVMGHCWSPFCGWNGGKGVATTVGSCLSCRRRSRCSACRSTSSDAVGRFMGWKQEGAISSLTTMFVIATLIFTIPAYIMFGIVLIRHIPNLAEIVRGPGGVAGARGSK